MIVVTGASSGIGKATAILLAASGARVALLGRDSGRLDEVHRLCPGSSVHASNIVDGIDLESILLAHGREEIQALVNCAGSGHVGNFCELPFEAVQADVSVNLLGLMKACHDVLPYFLKQGKGKIINVLSIAATSPFGGMAAYSASKAGALSFSRALSQEVRRSGVLVTSILPGAVDTPWWEGQSFQPPKADMLSAQAVAEVILSVIQQPYDRATDEIVLMPPKGIL